MPFQSKLTPQEYIDQAKEIIAGVKERQSCVNLTDRFNTEIEKIVTANRIAQMEIAAAMDDLARYFHNLAARWDTMIWAWEEKLRYGPED